MTTKDESTDARDAHRDSLRQKNWSDEARKKKLKKERELAARAVEKRRHEMIQTEQERLKSEFYERQRKRESER